MQIRCQKGAGTKMHKCLAGYTLHKTRHSRHFVYHLHDIKSIAPHWCSAQISIYYKTKLGFDCLFLLLTFCSKYYPHRVFFETLLDKFVFLNY